MKPYPSEDRRDEENPPREGDDSRKRHPGKRSKEIPPRQEKQGNPTQARREDQSKPHSHRGDARKPHPDKEARFKESQSL